MKLVSCILALLISLSLPGTATMSSAVAAERASIFQFTLFKRDDAKKSTKKKVYKKTKRARKSTAASRAKARRVAKQKAERAKARRVAAERRRKAAAKHAKLYARTTVFYPSSERRGTIIVDTKTRHLYHVLGNGRATRYGVAVGKQGFSWSGTSTIRHKVKWPTWTPPKEMIQRKPELAKWANGQPGGPANPLGAAALYLFQGKVDTLYRIHGTNAPGSIGYAASSGCIRMKNEDIQHLYSQVKNGTKVIVR